MATKEESSAYERILKLYGWAIMRPLLNSLSYLIKKDKEVLFLDIGCGPAMVALAVVQKIPSCRIYSLDMSSAMLKLSQKNTAANKRITILQADGKNFPLKTNHLILSYVLLWCIILQNHLHFLMRCSGLSVLKELFLYMTLSVRRNCSLSCVSRYSLCFLTEWQKKNTGIRYTAAIRLGNGKNYWLVLS